MSDLFDLKLEQELKKSAPLADRMRPTSLDSYAGQEKLIGPGATLRTLIERDELPSMIFWGPPGTGKTTLARIIAKLTRSRFEQVSAVASGIAELRRVVDEAKEKRKLANTRTILFVDEIHRWNKSQQDALLPNVESGVITLIGATTENPSFEVNGALLSRCRVFVLEKLTAEDIKKLLERAVKSPGGLDGKIKVDDEAIEFLAYIADGDARVALNSLEIAAKALKISKRQTLKVEAVKYALQKTHLRYDKTGEEHYNIISALHKSMRGSDANAALYWLGRMLEAGEDPLYVARRLVRFASEDIGLADSQALAVAMNAYNAAHAIGMPECNVILAHAAAYLAKAPKSNKLYTAYMAVQKDIAELPNEPVPLHLRNAPTKLMKELDYGKGYKYNPNFKGPVDQDYLPEKLKDRKYLESD
jgi:putative ATPase